jgi:hypothetical protein
MLLDVHNVAGVLLAFTGLTLLVGVSLPHLGVQLDLTYPSITFASLCTTGSFTHCLKFLDRCYGP